MELKYISAKDLCTRSAMQMKMFLEKPHLKPKPNINQFKGIEHQHNIIKQIKGVIGEEMGSHIQVGDIRMYFSNDIITKNTIIEIKHIDPLRSVEQWYLNSSLLQCAIYSTLCKMTNYSLSTSKFFVNEGNEYKTYKFDTNSKIYYALFFGNEKYLINVHNFDAIEKWIISKINALTSWEKAKEFDNIYKKREFEYLKNFFTVCKLDKK